jgi:hypothetical protein
MSARQPGRSTRATSIGTAFASDEWCFENVLTATSNEASSSGRAATSLTMKVWLADTEHMARLDMTPRAFRSRRRHLSACDHLALNRAGSLGKPTLDSRTTAAADAPTTGRTLERLPDQCCPGVGTEPLATPSSREGDFRPMKSSGTAGMVSTRSNRIGGRATRAGLR